jgi:hypothetical protein
MADEQQTVGVPNEPGVDGQEDAPGGRQDILAAWPQWAHPHGVAYDVRWTPEVCRLAAVRDVLLADAREWNAHAGARTRR